ncbi:hypothetical protein SAMN06264867_1184 [Halorubrum cibi]|uniref:Uncharacterized protein n=1 Tax=Halorubrum cibi TaxID=413815 RepID=A0A521F541_9EURY|nr:hypothetical protein SAMN06264867_1184 [Halorubrum cibi]
MTLRQIVGRWIQEGGTLLFLAGTLVKMIFEFTFTVLVMYPLSLVIETTIPLENLLRAASGASPTSPSIAVAGTITGIFFFCRWDQPEANKPSALTERFSLWASRLTDEED